MGSDEFGCLFVILQLGASALTVSPALREEKAYLVVGHAPRALPKLSVFPAGLQEAVWHPG